MKKARSIVNDIVKEIEERVSSPHSDEALLKEFQDKQKEIEDAVLQDFSGGVPRKHVARIRQILGNEFIDILDQGKIGPLVWKGKERLERIYQRLASLLALYLHYEKEARAKTLEVERLNKIKDELIESQVSHIHEVEMLETQLQGYKMLMKIALEPFEDAMKKIMSFLDAKQIEVFLFDDDRFLATELKTDGETFTYNQQEEKPEIPEIVSEVKLQEKKETTLDVPLVVEGKQIGHFRLERQASGDFDKVKWKRDVEWITSVLARVIESNRNLILARKVYIDDLTQMYNKRKLNEQMGKLFKQFKRGDKELYIAMIDIDKFKLLNDTYGHPVGDEILKQTAVIFKEELPFAYRYGGEEFAGVFYGFDKERTLEIMERLRKRIEKTVYSIKGQEYRITISAGISKFETHMSSVMDAIDRADQALYASKEDGRNRCTYYNDVKDRLSSDAAKLRQEILQLKEQMSRVTRENKRLAGQTNKKTGED
ncbi:MAG: GGDEF domain-containing protein [Nitrospirae bacterium]|nr:GGDEF domain-containing protein [Nitrospirota bacterium]